MNSLSSIIKEKPWVGWILFLFTMLIVFFIGLFASSIIERRAEALIAYKATVGYDDYEPRSQIWGKNFPRQYASWLKTSDTSFRSMYNGNATIDMLEVDPRLVVLWAGYAFAKDYKQSRGHYYSVTDVYNTLRTGAPMKPDEGPQPNTCWTCKSPDVPRLMSKTNAAEFYKGMWASKGAEVVNPIGCADCHDAKTMNLHISRPALVEAYKRQGIDISNATLQEIRSLVCAQCHVEYYFDKKQIEGTSYLVFPWDKGMCVDSIEKYYDTNEFTDWVHALSKAPMLKAQHPDYEIFRTGIHYDRGVSCADCHMPYISEGGQKFSNHHIQSPLNNISNTCQVCHREETDEIIRDVYERQQKIIANRDKLEELLVHAHIEAKYAWQYGALEKDMKPVLLLIRQAQWRWDFAAAGHGNSFHSPLETSRIISDGLLKVSEARLLLARILASLGHNQPIPYPDIATKLKAQQFIGLDMTNLRTEKQKFLEQIVPKWLDEAQKREINYPIKNYNQQ